MYRLECICHIPVLAKHGIVVVQGTGKRKTYTCATREDDELEVLAQGGDCADDILEHLLIDSDFFIEVLSH